MATATEPGRFADHFARPAMGHASESVSERPGREGAEQPMEQPSSSTDVSNKSLSVQNGHRAFSPTPAVESREPSATNTQHLQAAQGRAGAFCALPGFAQDPTAPASTEQALFDEAARAVSEEAPSDDSELEADERDTSPAQDLHQADASPKQRRASALAASKKVSDYISQGTKSIRVLRQEMDGAPARKASRGRGGGRGSRGGRGGAAAKPRKSQAKRSSASSSPVLSAAVPSEPLPGQTVPPTGMHPPQLLHQLPQISVPISLPPLSVGVLPANAAAAKSAAQAASAAGMGFPPMGLFQALPAGCLPQSCLPAYPQQQSRLLAQIQMEVAANAQMQRHQQHPQAGMHPASFGFSHLPRPMGPGPAAHNSHQHQQQEEQQQQYQQQQPAPSFHGLVASPFARPVPKTAAHSASASGTPSPLLGAPPLPLPQPSARIISQGLAPHIAIAAPTKHLSTSLSSHVASPVRMAAIKPELLPYLAADYAEPKPGSPPAARQEPAPPQSPPPQLQPPAQDSHFTPAASPEPVAQPEAQASDPPEPMQPVVQPAAQLQEEAKPALSEDEAESDSDYVAEQPAQPTRPHAIRTVAPQQQVEPQAVVQNGAAVKPLKPRVQVVKGADGAPRVKRQYTKRSPKWGPAAVKQEETETEPKEEAEAAADTAEPALELRSSVLGRRTSKPKLPESAAPLPIKRRRKYITTAKEGGSRGRGQSRASSTSRASWGKKRGRVVEDELELEELELEAEQDEDEEDEEMVQLFGCPKCKYTPTGCVGCRDSPLFERPKNLHWQPDKGRPQSGIPSAPTFYPTEEEFADPLKYINSVRAEGEKCGIACIVPPKGWAPPFTLDKGTNGQHSDSFKFSIRKQLTSHLCTRLANTKTDRKKKAAGRYTSRKPGTEGEGDAEVPDCDGEFGFVTLDKPQTLKSFRAYAQWAKNMHFSNPAPKGNRSAQQKRRRVQQDIEPSVEEVEAEFWRIVETPDQVVESLYGQDLDSGQHGSGFPLPPYRQRLLEEHLAKVALAEAEAVGDAEALAKAAEAVKPRQYSAEEKAYSEHPWNINNLTRCKGSVLRYLVGEELITGVMVPWLYVGSCMSAFCWHVEDHALYSINYLHQGAPKVWYGVPTNASETLEAAMHDALPHLFEATPSLLYQLVTLLSPKQLQARGVPVHRLVHEEGSFVITFPNAYHSGFNTGSNCAEAVNFGPPDWLPWGHYVGDKYRKDGKAATLSNDALLVNLAKAAPLVKQRLEGEHGPTAAEVSAMQPAAAPQVVYKDATEALDADGNAMDGDSDSSEQDMVKLALEGSPEGGLKVQLRIVDGQEEPAEAESAHDSARQQEADQPSGYVPGKRADISYLDPINHADTPATAVQLGTAQLTLRLDEERRRRQAGLKMAPGLASMRMRGTTPASKDEQGMYINTEDTDCEQCKCDLYLSAIVSSACPGKAACPEHASCLPCAPSSWILLYRYTMDELEEFVAEAKCCIPGTAEAVLAAQSLKAHPPPQPATKQLGPLICHHSPKQAGTKRPSPESDEPNGDVFHPAQQRQPPRSRRGPQASKMGAGKGTRKRKQANGYEPGGKRHAQAVTMAPAKVSVETSNANKAKMAKARQAKAEKSIMRRKEKIAQLSTPEGVSLAAEQHVEAPASVAARSEGSAEPMAVDEAAAGETTVSDRTEHTEDGQRIKAEPATSSLTQATVAASQPPADVPDARRVNRRRQVSPQATEQALAAASDPASAELLAAASDEVMQAAPPASEASVPPLGGPAFSNQLSQHLAANATLLSQLCASGWLPNLAGHLANPLFTNIANEGNGQMRWPMPAASASAPSSAWETSLGSMAPQGYNPMGLMNMGLPPQLPDLNLLGSAGLPYMPPAQPLHSADAPDQEQPAESRDVSESQAAQQAESMGTQAQQQSPYLGYQLPMGGAWAHNGLLAGLGGFGMQGNYLSDMQAALLHMGAQQQQVQPEQEQPEQGASAGHAAAFDLPQAAMSAQGYGGSSAEVAPPFEASSQPAGILEAAAAAQSQADGESSAQAAHSAAEDCQPAVQHSSMAALHQMLHAQIVQQQAQEEQDRQMQQQPQLSYLPAPTAQPIDSVAHQQHSEAGMLRPAEDDRLSVDLGDNIVDLPL